MLSPNGRIPTENNFRDNASNRNCSKTRYSPAKHRSNGYNGKSLSRGCKNCASAAVKGNPDTSPVSTSHLLPDRNCTLRASLVSNALETVLLSMQHFSKAAMNVFLVVPCSRHRCCIGCVSLRDAVALICVAELVVIGLCSLIALDIYLTDGRIFYTKEVEGHGAMVAFVFCTFCIISIPIILFTLGVWHFRIPNLYIVHVLWQWTVLEVLLFFAYEVLKRVFSSELRQRTGFLLPSAIVLAFAAISAVVVQSWWTSVMIDAMFFEMSDTSSRRERREAGSKCGDNDGDDSASTDSRHRSSASPKVDRSKPMEIVSIGDTRIATLARVNENPEFTDVVNV
uniref:Transmembrane protein n=1 Tax=Haemonchus contortus TaxID=6289 RepID=A0A7I4YN74_HAECO